MCAGEPAPAPAALPPPTGKYTCSRKGDCGDDQDDGGGARGDDDDGGGGSTSGG